MSSLCIIIIKKNDNKVKCWKTELSYTVAEHKTSLTDPIKDTASRSVWHWNET